MRVLFTAALHHPEVLAAERAAAPPGQPPPLFPSSQAQHFWDRAWRKRGWETAAFFRNLPALGGGARQTERFSTGLTPAKLLRGVMNRLPPELNLDYRLRNRRLIEQAAAFRPDVVWLTGDNRVIYPETLAAIKAETGCKLIYVTGTSPIVFSTAVERAAARLYDLVLTNDFYHGIQWLELGAPRMECLPLSAVDPEFHRPYTLTEAQRREYACDIAFVGTLVPDTLYRRRVQALEALRDFDLGIWSVHEVPASLRAQVRGAALGEDMLEVLSAAKITINVHGDFMRYGGNMRLFEAAGVGVLQIADALPGSLTWFTEGKTIVTYRDMGDLRQKVAYYLSHDAERETVARRARDHVYALHTYDVRIARIETLLREL